MNECMHACMNQPTDRSTHHVLSQRARQRAGGWSGSGRGSPSGKVEVGGRYDGCQSWRRQQAGLGLLAGVPAHDSGQPSGRYNTTLSIARANLTSSRTNMMQMASAMALVPSMKL